MNDAEPEIGNRLVTGCLTSVHNHFLFRTLLFVFFKIIN